jgi:hypothetical protein
LELQSAAINSETQLRAVATAPSTPQTGAVGRVATAFNPAFAVAAAAAVGTQQPISDELRNRALLEVDAQLVRQKLIDRAGGVVAKPVQIEINYERQTSIPTAGVIVKSCIDECDICEDEVHRREKLELDRLELQNKLLARQIELLDKSQEYRCCPVEEAGNA